MTTAVNILGLLTSFGLGGFAHALISRPRKPPLPTTVAEIRRQPWPAPLKPYPDRPDATPGAPGHATQPGLDEIITMFEQLLARLLALKTAFQTTQAAQAAAAQKAQDAAVTAAVAAAEDNHAVEIGQLEKAVMELEAMVVKPADAPPTVDQTTAVLVPADETNTTTDHIVSSAPDGTTIVTPVMAGTVTPGTAVVAPDGSVSIDMTLAPDATDPAPTLGTPSDTLPQGITTVQDHVDDGATVVSATADPAP